MHDDSVLLMCKLQVVGKNDDSGIAARSASGQVLVHKPTNDSFSSPSQIYTHGCYTEIMPGVSGQLVGR